MLPHRSEQPSDVVKAQRDYHILCSRANSLLSYGLIYGLDPKQAAEYRALVARGITDDHDSFCDILEARYIERSETVDTELPPAYTKRKRDEREEDSAAKHKRPMISLPHRGKATPQLDTDQFADAEADVQSHWADRQRTTVLQNPVKADRRICLSTLEAWKWSEAWKELEAWEELREFSGGRRLPWGEVRDPFGMLKQIRTYTSFKSEESKAGRDCLWSRKIAEARIP